MGRLRLLACEVFKREFDAVLAGNDRDIEVTYVAQGLHDERAGTMAQHLQGHIDACKPGEYCAILLGYGLCNNGIAGLRARHTPLVVARAHDCITWFLGSRERYDKVFKEAPGSYYLTSGWIETARRSLESLPTRLSGADTKSDTYLDFVKRFGEDNAQFLMETMGAWKKKYGRMVFINLKVGDTEKYRDYAKEQAAEREMEYQELAGSLRLFGGLVDGPPWNEEEYLIVPAGHEIHPSYDEQVVVARRPTSAA